MREETIGPHAIEFTYHEDIDASSEVVRGERRGHNTRNLNSRYVHKEGRVVMLSWMGVWSEPVSRFFYIGRDMTESQLAQETLRENEQLARGIIETALDAFVQVDQTGRILDFNPQAEVIFRWPPSTPPGKTSIDLLIGEAPPQGL